MQRHFFHVTSGRFVSSVSPTDVRLARQSQNTIRTRKINSTALEKRRIHTAYSPSSLSRAAWKISKLVPVQESERGRVRARHSWLVAISLRFGARESLASTRSRLARPDSCHAAWRRIERARHERPTRGELCLALYAPRVTLDYWPFINGARAGETFLLNNDLSSVICFPDFCPLYRDGSCADVGTR